MIIIIILIIIIIITESQGKTIGIVRNKYNIHKNILKFK